MRPYTQAIAFAVFSFFICVPLLAQERTNLRDMGIEIGIFRTGPTNSIVDIPGVSVGHVTVIEGESIRTGVTAILPHKGNIFQQKVPAAIHVGNGFGKLAGSTQVEELGNIETPIILTNTLSVAAGVKGVVKYTLSQDGNEEVRSVNAVIGETNDGFLNDIRGMDITSSHVIQAILSANNKEVAQGNVGAGTGTRSFGYKSGIGSASRVIPESLGGYNVGVIVQSNFGGVLEIAGVPVGQELDRYPFSTEINNPDGSCMIVVLTDAPLLSRNLKRLAKRAMLGLAKTGGMSSNGSGDYVIAASTSEKVRIPYQNVPQELSTSYVPNDHMSPLFQAVIEATEEAILNALFAAETMTGHRGRTTQAIDLNQVKSLLKKYGKL